MNHSFKQNLFVAVWTVFSMIVAIPVLQGEGAVFPPPPPPPKASIKARPSSMTMTVPVLGVYRNGKGKGELEQREITVTRRQDDSAPLRVMLVDDIPNGSGISSHNSVWQAAMTAGILRNDTLHGVTITVQYSGTVEGPSAGGVMCLAILSALDGVPLPNDFAMTGTILPDGTIGIVGGVPAKMRAAAAAGKKRIFLPSFLRMAIEYVLDEQGNNVKDEKGVDKEREVDLQLLAEELKMEIHWVDNILDAYAELHHRPPKQRGYVNLKQRLRLPSESERVLVKYYRHFHEKVLQKLKQYPKCDVGDIYEYGSFSPEFAEILYNDGRLLAATIRMAICWFTWKAEEQTYQVSTEFKSKDPDWNRIVFLQEYHYRKRLVSFAAEISAIGQRLRQEYTERDNEKIKKQLNLKEIKADVGYYPEAVGQTEICAQLAPVSMKTRECGNLEYYLARELDTEAFGTASLKELKEDMQYKIYILRQFFLLYQDTRELNDFLQELANTLPNLKALPRAREVESMFYAMGETVSAVAHENYGYHKHTPDEKPGIVKSCLEANEQFFLSLHELLTPKSGASLAVSAYHLQYSLKGQIQRVTLAAAKAFLYGQEYKLPYVPHFLRNAREMAIQNLDECIGAGVPCLAPICDFELAEALSGTAHILEALRAYWRASLYAKALRMSFANAGK